MERFFNLNQFNNQKNIIKKRKPSIRIAVQIDEDHLENNVISFKNLFQTSTYIHKKKDYNIDDKQEYLSTSESSNNLNNSNSIDNSNNEIKSHIIYPSCSENELENSIIKKSITLKKGLNSNLLTPVESEYEINENMNSGTDIETNNDESLYEIDNEGTLERERNNIDKIYKKNEEDIEELEELEQTELEELEQQKYNNRYVNEIENIINNDKQPLDIKKALYLRDMIEKEKYKELKKQMFQQKKRKVYETYDKNDPFIDDSEDYIMNNSLKIQKIEKQEFVVWSGIYGKNKRKRNSKIKQSKNIKIIPIPKKENKLIEQIPSTLYPLDPKLEVLMKKLKIQSDKCNWNENESIPETLLILKHKFINDVAYLKNVVESLLLEEKILNITNDQNVHKKTLKNIIDRYKSNITSFNVSYRFSWNECSRISLYNIINLELKKNMLISNEQNLEPRIQNNSNNKIIVKKICEDLISLWPESTVKIATLIREYSYVKNKKEKSSIFSEKNNSKFKMTEKTNISTDNHYVIKIRDKSKQLNDNLILPKFIKSTSIYYPNHNKHYQRSVLKMSKDEIIQNNNNIKGNINTPKNKMNHEELIPINKFNELIGRNKLLSYKLKNKSNNRNSEDSGEDYLISESNKNEKSANFKSHNIDMIDMNNTKSNKDSNNNNDSNINININGSKMNEITINNVTKTKTENNNKISQTNLNSNKNSGKHEYPFNFDSNQSTELDINQPLKHNNEKFVMENHVNQDLKNNITSNNTPKVSELLMFEINQLKDIISFMQNNTNLDDTDSKLVFLSSLKDYFNMMQSKVLNNQNDEPFLSNLLEFIHTINPKTILKSTHMNKSALKPKNLISHTNDISSSLNSDITLTKKDKSTNDNNLSNYGNNNDDEMLGNLNHSCEVSSSNIIQHQVTNINSSKNISLKRKSFIQVGSPLQKITKLSNESENSENKKIISKQIYVENSIDNNNNSNNINKSDSSPKFYNVNRFNQKVVLKKENNLNKENNLRNINKIIYKKVSTERPINHRKNKPKPRAFSRRKTIHNKTMITNTNIPTTSVNKSKSSFTSKTNETNISHNLPLHKLNSNSTVTNKASSFPTNEIKFSNSNKTENNTTSPSLSNNNISNVNVISNINDIPTTSISHKINKHKINETTDRINKPLTSISKLINTFNTENIPSSLNFESVRENKNTTNMLPKINSHKIESPKRMSIKLDYPSSSSSMINNDCSPSKNSLNTLNKTSVINKDDLYIKRHELNRLDILKDKYQMLSNQNKENINNNETSTTNESRKGKKLNSQENSSLTNEWIEPLYYQDEDNQSIYNKRGLYQNMGNVLTKNVFNTKNKKNSPIRLSLNRNK
ncbi:hypothetical protein PIROE2DRAFT_15604 [Piromyces sp. E2]|nr:hypothetical protein PIROE2DRAFT_15604 [Piromyces sp. E2]|eukprot:OUM58991.1 hypothetical protein PIROE2DRAFT_15604 [Piromyces sp. E2]